MIRSKYMDQSVHMVANGNYATTYASKVMNEANVASLNWQIIAIIELFLLVVVSCVLVFIHLRHRHKKPKSKNVDDVDFHNVMNSAFKAEQLYNDLKRKYHPDRFSIDNSKFEIATEISKEIAKERYNYAGLQALQARAQSLLTNDSKQKN